MTTTADAIPGYPLRHARRDILHMEFTQTIGASGAVGALDKDDPAVTVTKEGGTGTYSMTYPKAAKGRLFWSLISPAATVKTAWITAFDPTAGTATLVTGNGGGTATNPADGDKIQFFLTLDSRT